MPQYVFANNADMFDRDPEPPLLTIPLFEDVSAIDQLLALCNDLPFERHYVAGTYLMPREILWFGPCSYTYSGVTHHARSMPEWLAALKTQLENKVSAEMQKPVAFNSVLLNRYRNHLDSVGWHADDEPELGTQPIIASISLGATREFSFRLRKRPAIQYHVPLRHGDCVVMHSHCQEDWHHAILKSNEVCGSRINLTFRYTFS